MTSLKAIIITVLLAYTSIYTTIQLVQLAKEDMRQYKEDMKCIHVLVSQGIERKDITSKDGICIVDEDIYYKSINN